MVPSGSSCRRGSSTSTDSSKLNALNLEAAFDEAAQRGDPALPSERLDHEIAVHALHLAEVERAVCAAPQERPEANALGRQLNRAAAADGALLTLEVLRHLDGELLQV